MQNVFLALHLIIAAVLVFAVLMQRSEGGALGMGGGGTGGLISGRGAADMMVNITSWVGGAFFVTSIVLAVLAGAQPAERSVIDDAGARKGGIQFNIPGLPGAPAPQGAAPAASSPTTTPVTGAATGAGPLAPAPESAVTRAGPLAAQPAAAPAAAAPRPAAVRTPVGAAPAATGAAGQPVGAGAPKATGTAPMIPLPAAPTPAPAAESAQVPAPAPPPSREKVGPDE